MRPCVIRREFTPQAMIWHVWHRELHENVATIVVQTLDTVRWYIRSVWVKRDFRNQQWASRLLERVLHEARQCQGVQQVELDNCLSNPQSTLYSRLGFAFVQPCDNTMRRDVFCGTVAKEEK